MQYHHPIPRRGGGIDKEGTKNDDSETNQKRNKLRKSDGNSQIVNKSLPLRSLQAIELIKCKRSQIPHPQLQPNYGEIGELEIIQDSVQPTSEQGFDQTTNITKTSESLSISRDELRFQSHIQPQMTNPPARILKEASPYRKIQQKESNQIRLTVSHSNNQEQQKEQKEQKEKIQQFDQGYKKWSIFSACSQNQELDIQGNKFKPPTLRSSMVTFSNLKRVPAANPNSATAFSVADSGNSSAQNQTFFTFDQETEISAPDKAQNMEITSRQSIDSSSRSSLSRINLSQQQSLLYGQRNILIKHVGDVIPLAELSKATEEKTSQLDKYKLGNSEAPFRNMQIQDIIQKSATSQFCNEAEISGQNLQRAVISVNEAEKKEGKEQQNILKRNNKKQTGQIKMQMQHEHQMNKEKRNAYISSEKCRQLMSDIVNGDEREVDKIILGSLEKSVFFEWVIFEAQKLFYTQELQVYIQYTLKPNIFLQKVVLSPLLLLENNQMIAFASLKIKKSCFFRIIRCLYLSIHSHMNKLIFLYLFDCSTLIFFYLSMSTTIYSNMSITNYSNMDTILYYLLFLIFAIQIILSIAYSYFHKFQNKSFFGHIFIFSAFLRIVLLSLSQFTDTRTISQQLETISARTILGLLSITITYFIQKTLSFAKLFLICFQITPE